MFVIDKHACSLRKKTRQKSFMASAQEEDRIPAWKHHSVKNTGLDWAIVLPEHVPI